MNGGRPDLRLVESFVGTRLDEVAAGRAPLVSFEELVTSTFGDSELAATNRRALLVGTLAVWHRGHKVTGIELAPYRAIVERILGELGI